jgi:hypothetical protein
VSALRSTDAAVQEFHINIPDPNHYFDLVLALASGGELTLDIKGEQMQFIRFLSLDLGNSELFELTVDPSRGDDEHQTPIGRLHFHSGHGTEHMRAIASRFHEFDKSEFDLLDSSHLQAILSDPELLLETEDSLFDLICHRLGQSASDLSLLEFVRFEFLSAHCMESAVDLLSGSLDAINQKIWTRILNRLALPVIATENPRRFRLPPLDSKILERCPEIFSVFQRKVLRLLYRASRDGFASADFHRCCNGHPNTVTVARSTLGHIFGGYTPVAWASRGGYVADPSMQSFLFTLQNPHSLPARIFKLKQADRAIYDDAGYGPMFGGGVDLKIWNPYSGASHSYTILGVSYENDTGLAGNTVFTGSQAFVVTEVEVFEVMDHA